MQRLNALAGSGIVAHAMPLGPVVTNFYNYAPDDTCKLAASLPTLTEKQGPARWSGFPPTARPASAAVAIGKTDVRAR